MTKHYVIMFDEEVVLHASTPQPSRDISLLCQQEESRIKPDRSSAQRYVPTPEYIHYLS